MTWEGSLQALVFCLVAGIWMAVLDTLFGWSDRDTLESTRRCDIDPKDVQIVTMARVCSWCNRQLSGTRAQVERGEITHTICDQCIANHYPLEKPVEAGDGPDSRG